MKKLLWTTVLTLMMTLLYASGENETSYDEVHYLSAEEDIYNLDIEIDEPDYYLKLKTYSISNDNSQSVTISRDPHANQFFLEGAGISLDLLLSILSTDELATYYIGPERDAKNLSYLSDNPYRHLLIDISARTRLNDVPYTDAVSLILKELFEFEIHELKNHNEIYYEIKLTDTRTMLKNRIDPNIADIVYKEGSPSESRDDEKGVYYGTMHDILWDLSFIFPHEQIIMAPGFSHDHLIFSFPIDGYDTREEYFALFEEWGFTITPYKKTLYQVTFINQ